MKKKAPFTLLELLLSFTLATVLLSCLFIHFRSLLLFYREIETKKEQAEQEALLLISLSRLFSHLEEPLSFQLAKEKLGFSCTYSPEAFSFDWQGKVGALIYFADQALFLELTSSSGDTRQERLLDSLSSFSWKFFRLDGSKLLFETPLAQREPQGIVLLCDEKEYVFYFPTFSQPLEISS